MNFIYNIFLTKKNLSSKDLEDISNIFQFTSSKYSSILEKYKDDINLYIENNKIDLKKFDKNNILNKLSQTYNNIFIKENNIKLFFYYLIDSKMFLTKNISNINSFMELYNNFDRKHIKNYSQHEYFYNPYSYITPFSHNINITSRNLNDKFFNIKNYFKFNKNFDNSFNDLKILLDILTQGKIINISLPSVGIIKNNFSSDKESYSYLHFIDKIVNLKSNDEDISKYIPLKYLDIGNVISELLFDIDNEEFNTLKINFKNTINNINIDLDEIFYDKLSENNKKLKKIKTEFIIPYKLEKKTDIVLYSKNDINKIKNIKDLFEKNNFIIKYILKKINQTKNNKNILNTSNFKNILCCYMFYIINVLFAISKTYIDKIDFILFDIVASKNKRYGNLNIKKAFEYTSNLKKSLYKFKTVLLNNFYYLFTPLNFLSGNYGMKLHELGFYIPDGKILRTNEDLLFDYPFYSKYENINSSTSNTTNSNNIIISFSKLSNFLLNIKYDYDIYDKKHLLEIGGNSFDYTLIKKCLFVLFEYYEYKEKYDKFNLFIINILIKNFIDKNIPIEILDKIDSSLYFSKLNKSEFERKVILKYENNMEKAIDFIINVMSIREKIKNSKKIDIDYLNNLETIYLCSFNIYYLKSQAIINFIKNLNLDINFKNLLLEKLLKKRKEYEDFIKKKK